MEKNITGKTIKSLRKNKKMTQLKLAQILNVSDKTISKWETGRGLPDITLLEPLAKALSVSSLELINGSYVKNNNISSNLLRLNTYVCSNCGNVMWTIGENVNSCCGTICKKEVAKNEDEKHKIRVEKIEDEIYISINHEMTKSHYISFITYVTQNRFEIVKLYPEQNAEARFFYRGKGIVYVYCNKDGLIKKIIL